MNEIKKTYKDFGLSELEYNFLVNHICDNRASVFIIGCTGSGKTSFSNLLIKEFDDNELISVVGDTHDYIFHENQKVSEIFIKDDDYSIAFDLLMRSKPDRVLVPELSVSNVSLILKAIKSRHKGFMLTMYSPNENTEIAKAFSENLKIAGVNEVDIIAIDKTINSNIDFIIHLKKHKGKIIIDKVAINNLEAQKEAKKLGIFGFKAPFKEKFISLKNILKMEKDTMKIKNITDEELENLLKKYPFETGIQEKIEEVKKKALISYWDNLTDADRIEYLSKLVRRLEKQRNAMRTTMLGCFICMIFMWISILTKMI
jgi:hypothetical protein